MGSLARRLLAGLVLVSAATWYGAEAPLAAAESAKPAEAAPARDARLQDQVSALSRWVSEGRGKFGAAIVSLKGSRLLAAAGEAAPLNPASNQKILTAAVALARLGPQYRYNTAVFGTIRDGSSPSLVLRGHGDPSLTTSDLWQLATTLARMGLKRVDGPLYVDQSRFDAQFVPPAYEQQPNEWAEFRAPISAVAVNGNAITLGVAPGREGEPAHVWFDPPGLVTATGGVATEAAGKGNAVRWSLQESGGRLLASLGGHIAAGLPRVSFSRRLGDPRLAAGHVFKHLLNAAGVEVRGEVSEGGSGEKNELVRHSSRPLAELLSALGKESDNFYAETVLKSLGAEVSGAPGTSAAGAAAIVDYMRQVQALTPGVQIKNGSGLFDANRVSALGMVRVLEAAHRDPAISAEFIAQLAVGGVDGTLRSRFRTHKTTRAVRAKTGTLNNVVALSGYVLAPPGKSPVAFSLFITDLPGKHGESRQRIDEIVEAIASELWSA